MTTIYDFPDICPDNMDWALVANTKAFTSDLNGATQAAEIPGTRWNATLVFTNRFGRDARALRGFLARLGGLAGRFKLSPEDYEPIGTALGSGFVNGGGQNGESIVTDGWDANQPLLFASGDFVTINNEMKMIVEDISSDAFGNAILKITPIFRNPPLDNTPIESIKPFSIMQLVDNEQAQWAVSSPEIYALSFACMEAIDI